MRKLAVDGVRWLFRTAGLEVTRARGVRRTLRQALQYLKSRGVAPATVFDVGAAFGTFALYETFPYALHVLVEPLKEFDAPLRSIASRYRCEIVRAAAGARAGSTVIEVKERITGSSKFREAGGGGAVVEGHLRTVPVVALDDVKREKSLVGPYLLKADVEGAELEVIEGAQEVLGETEAVVLEVTFRPKLTGAPDFAEVVEVMSECGWVVYDLVDMRNSPDGVLFQADAVFVRKVSRLRGDANVGERQ